jgi:NTE family protein
LVDDYSRHRRLLQAQSVGSRWRRFCAGTGARRLLHDCPLAEDEELVDFDLVNPCRPRLTVGAAHVRTSHMHYFDSRDGSITVKHVMASGALPPAFPAVRINGELYWDGGILSNTPTEAVFDDNPRKDSLIFSVHLWNPLGSEPTTMAEVFNRHKDVQYSSRIASQIVRQ